MMNINGKNIDPPVQQISIPNQHVTNGNDRALGSTPYNINQIEVVKSPNTHIGPKFTTSNLNLYLSRPKKLNSSRSFAQGYFIAAVGTVVFLLFLYLTFEFPLQVEHVEHNVTDQGSAPLDLYYDRELMSLPVCPPSYLNVTADHIIVDSMKVDCDEVDACIDIIRGLHGESHFYLKGGRIFEGLGWNCYPAEFLKIVFLSEVPSQTELYSYNILLDIGQATKAIAKKYEVLPICCFSGDLGPSEAVMNFLKTLVNFRNRECIINYPNCY